MFRGGKLIDRIVGFRGAGPIREWIAEHTSPESVNS
jgi:hypothetical protein